MTTFRQRGRDTLQSTGRPAGFSPRYAKGPKRDYQEEPRLRFTTFAAIALTVALAIYFAGQYLRPRPFAPGERPCAVAGSCQQVPRG